MLPSHRKGIHDKSRCVIEFALNSAKHRQNKKTALAVNCSLPDEHAKIGTPSWYTSQYLLPSARTAIAAAAASAQRTLCGLAFRHANASHTIAPTGRRASLSGYT